VIFAAGTGNPYFTTDSAAALRAAEIHADALLKGTQVEGIFTGDPRTDPEARLLAEVTYQQVLERDLKIMDGAAIALCRDNGIPIAVFDLGGESNLRRIVLGERVGSIVRAR
jgi:uridylate kinase